MKDGFDRLLSSRHRAGLRTGAAVKIAAFSWGFAGYGRTQLLEAHAREDEDTMPIDITFDFRTDSNGENPDFASPTLRRNHHLLWSKPLSTLEYASRGVVGFEVAGRVHHEVGSSA